MTNNKSNFDQIQEFEDFVYYMKFKEIVLLDTM